MLSDAECDWLINYASEVGLKTPPDPTRQMGAQEVRSITIVDANQDRKLSVDEVRFVSPRRQSVCLYSTSPFFTDASDVGGELWIVSF